VRECVCVCAKYDLLGEEVRVGRFGYRIQSSRLPDVCPPPPTPFTVYRLASGLTVVVAVVLAKWAWEVEVQERSVVSPSFPA
jgi:hypothetical protein